jgi:anti-sigma regulatory factor (Ser/Thr protein kinase)
MTSARTSARPGPSQMNGAATTPADSAGATPADATPAGDAPPGADEVSLPGIAVSVSAARAFVRNALAGCPRADDLVQAASELAANAVVWSSSGEGGTFTVRVRTAPRWARVEVIDNGPAARPRDLSNGWGLEIVATITDRASASLGADGSRTTWAEATWAATETQAKTGTEAGTRTEITDQGK